MLVAVSQNALKTSQPFARCTSSLMVPHSSYLRILYDPINPPNNAKMFEGHAPELWIAWLAMQRRGAV
jgi:hypothetical protein